MPTQWMTTEEVCQYLAFDKTHPNSQRQALYEFRARYDLPSVKRGKRNLYREQDVRAAEQRFTKEQQR